MLNKLFEIGGIVILSVVIPNALYALSDTISVVPRPVNMSVLDGFFTITEKTVILTDQKSAALGKQFSEMLAPATGFNLQVKESDKSTENSIRLEINASQTKLGPEGYGLNVTDKGIIVIAAQPAGIFYGLETLRQLLPADIFKKTKVNNVEWSIPCVKIIDYPRFKWRGMMLDVSRYFFNKDFVLKYIDIMAMHKLNVLQLHLTDDPGWRLEIKKYPKLTEIGGFRGKGDQKYGGFYTQEDIKEIVRYAKTKNITVVPEIEFPAHNRAAVVAYPHLTCTGQQLEVPNQHFISEDLFCAGNEKTYEFLEDVFDEVVQLFPSGIIHIGGDEAKYGRWKNCPKCQQAIKENNLKNEKELQSYMTKRVQDYLKTKGRSILGWDELLECGLPGKATLMTWQRPNTAVEAAKKGNDVVMALTGHCYFDTPESKLPGEVQAATWLPPVPLQKAYDWNPVPNELNAEEAKHIIGPHGCVWSDQFLFGDKLRDKPGEGTTRSERYVEYLTLPRAAALAETGWTQQSGKDWKDFESRMRRQYRRYNNADYNFRVPLPSIESDGENLVFSPSVENAKVYYTMDGSQPDENSTLFNTKIKAQIGDSIKAITLVDSNTKSLVLEKRLVYPKNKWRIKHVDSENTNSGDNAANAIDENPDTIWHTQWEGGSPGYPHDIQIDLGETLDIKGMTYLPRQTGTLNGTVKEYECYVSSDGNNWGSPVTKGTFSYTNDNKAEQKMFFPENVKTRYIRFKAISEINGQPFASASEIGIIIAK